MGGASGDDPEGSDESIDATDRRTQAPEHGDSGGATDNDAQGTASGDSNATVEGTVAASEIDTAELTVDERSLHPRIRTIWIARAVLTALVVGAIAFAIDWVWLQVGLAVPLGVTTVAIALLVSHAVLSYRAWQYEFREDAIYLERGVVTRVRTVVPFVRIQHVDTARGPIERAAGLSTLVVYTAGSRGADVTIPGIQAERATDHQRRLKQLAIAAEDDTAV